MCVLTCEYALWKERPSPVALLYPIWALHWLVSMQSQSDVGRVFGGSLHHVQCIMPPPNLLHLLYFLFVKVSFILQEPLIQNVMKHQQNLSIR